jgi:hypothetical protein
MFSIQQQTATLAHLNVRAEKHGDEDVGAADLKISLTASNGILAEFHPVLRAAFYKAPETPPDQDEIFQSPADALTVRKFGTLIETVRLKHEIRGAAVTIGFGLGGASDIKLETVDVDHFAAELLEGGSCNITFRVKCSPSSDQIARLYEVLGGEIDITVTPPVNPQGSLLPAAA